MINVLAISSEVLISSCEKFSMTVGIYWLLIPRKTANVNIGLRRMGNRAAEMQGGRRFGDLLCCNMITVKIVFDKFKGTVLWIRDT